ncbi:MAG: hypothetical protein N4A47_05795 [Clostridia bacterium]|jgi:hypothetical protein|nr:hypothetical protein [Clostridia bacterium]
MKALKVFFITIMIGYIAWNVYQGYTGDKESEYNILVTECKMEKYPVDILGVIDRFNRLKLYMYSEESTISEIRELANWQKKMYHSELLEKNKNYNEIIKNIVKEKKNLIDKNIKLLKIEVVNGSLEYDPNNPNVGYIKVKEQTSKEFENIILYVMVKENDKWKIIGFKNERKIESGS